MPHDDMAWANLSAANDPALVEWLVGASCGPHVKAIVVRAVHASAWPLRLPRRVARNLQAPPRTIGPGSLLGTGTKRDAMACPAALVAGKGGWLT